MRIASIAAFLFVCCASPALSQTVTIRATVQSQNEKGVVLRLASGGAIVVPLADVVSGTNAVKPTSQQGVTRPNDAYRIARCGELARNPTLVPQATREQELRELKCDSVSASTSPATAVPTFDFRQKCATDWPSNFQVRAFCEKQQQEALSALNARVMTTPDRQVIRAQCLKQWPMDYQVRNFCEEQQIKALRDLGRER